MRFASARLLVLSLATLIPAPGSAETGFQAIQTEVEIEVQAATQPLQDEQPELPTGDSAAENGWTPNGNIENQNEAPAAPPLDLWERVRRGFAVAELNDEEVPYNKEYYASRPGYIKRIAERSKRYLFHILEEVERHGMPAEIALLPIIESVLNPTAYSNSQASGLWQLTSSTAKRYGLRQNWWYDERRDIIAATRAALSHLKKLHSLFGDWKLVIASYNWGEGAVRRALARKQTDGQSADFKDIELPPETRNFIRRLVVVKNMILDPAAFRIELNEIPNRPYFEKIPAAHPIDIKLAAKLAGVSLEEFKALNPAHNRPVINIDRPGEILIPADKVEVFNENLKKHSTELVSWQAYRPKTGETLETIAARFGIRVQRLKALNDLGPANDVTPGEALLVPIQGNKIGDDISILNSKPAVLKVPEGFIVYVVKKGDALFNIARRHGVTVDQIKSWNQATHRLSIGQKLILKGA
jgi:membrane-bound lytic murein transglycosylase D